MEYCFNKLSTPPPVWNIVYNKLSLSLSLSLGSKPPPGAEVRPAGLEAVSKERLGDCHLLICHLLIVGAASALQRKKTTQEDHVHSIRTIRHSVRTKRPLKKTTFKS
jgi:hypothetical protein